MLRSLVGIADDTFVFARHSEAARALMASTWSTTDAAAGQRAQASRSAASVVTALVELRWLLTAEVVYMLSSPFAERFPALPVSGLLPTYADQSVLITSHKLLQLPDDMMLAVAGALAASLSFHLDGCLKRASDGAECTAALQSAALAADGTEAAGLTVQLSVGEEGAGSSILLGPEHWLPVQPAVARMLRSASAGSSTAADATANLQALSVLAQLPIRGAHSCDCLFFTGVVTQQSSSTGAHVVPAQAHADNKRFSPASCPALSMATCQTGCAPRAHSTLRRPQPRPLSFCLRPF